MRLILAVSRASWLLLPPVREKSEVPESVGDGTLMHRLLLVAVVLILSAGCADTDTAGGEGPDTPESSLEYQLAVIHKGGFVAEDDPLVMRFARALDRLEAKCPETRQELADMGVKGRELLLESNIDEPLLEVFYNWRASIPDETQEGELGECLHILSAYMALRVGS